MPRPQRIYFTKLKDNATLNFGQAITLDLLGDTGDTGTAANLRRTGLFIQVFSQVPGQPRSKQVFTGTAVENDTAASKQFGTDPANPPTFVPIRRGPHTFTVLAWDRRTVPGAMTDILVKQLRVNVV
jgi:hypothetical protein